MKTYHLRSFEEIQEEIRILGIKKQDVEREYKHKLEEIAADASVMNAELMLLRSLGEIT